MVEVVEKKVVDGVLIVTLLILMSTTLVTLSDTGNNRTCTSGWEYVDSGTYEGKYYCTARPEVYYSCTSIRDSSKTSNYWCDEGEIIKIIKVEPPIVYPSDMEALYTEDCIVVDDFCYCDPRGYLGHKRPC